MDFKKVRFCYNKDDDNRYMEYLYSFLEPLFCNSITNLGIEFNEDVCSLSEHLIVISYDEFERHYSRNKDLVLRFLSSNKILLSSQFDLEFSWRWLIKDFPELLELDNLYRITDSPSVELDDRTFYISNNFLITLDVHGLSKLTEQNDINSFFCLMGKKRPHRDILYDLLINKELDKTNTITYHKYNKNRNEKEIFHDLLEFNPPGVHWGWRDGAISPYYNQYCFELAVENNNEYIFITEKTIKPLLTGMPFMIVSAIGHLRYLRSIGFKTYGDFIDESYDDEIDPSKRISMVVDELDRLTKKKEFSIIYKQTRNIAYQNRRNFCDMNSLVKNSYYQHLRDIIESL